jgi:hypothetical protein
MPSPTARNRGRKLLIGMFVVSVTSVAWGSPTFPKAVHDAVPMPCVPECTICHQTNAGGIGTLRPGGFGQNLVSFGLQFGQPNSVAPAIEAARPVLDGDADTRLDVAELAEGGDPNSADASASTCDVGPKYGCGAGRIARGDSLDGVATLFAGSALALGAALLHRRLRRP